MTESASQPTPTKHGACKALLLRMKRVYDFEKGESMKISIPCADAPDSMLTHEDGCVRVMQEITCNVRYLPDDLSGNICMPMRRDNETEPRRGEKRSDEPPCISYAPWPTHDLLMGRHTQELIKYRPGVNHASARGRRCSSQARRSVKRRILIGSIHQNIGIDDEHYRPSMAWYSASRSAISTSVPPL